ncbi:adenosine kinase [Nematocida sp. AWRm77]|nr:adenosine kinase [Nematocida sp. AWRm77]
MGIVLTVCVPFIDIVIPEPEMVHELGLPQNEMTMYQHLKPEAQSMLQTYLKEHIEKCSIKYGGMAYNTCMEIAQHTEGAESVFIGPFSSFDLSKKVFGRAIGQDIPGITVKPFYIDSYPGMCYIIPNEKNRCMITHINPDMEVSEGAVECLLGEIEKRKEAHARKSTIVYVTGYTVESSPPLKRIARRAQEEGLPALLCLNLSDPGVLKRSFGELLPFICASEWVIGNKAEFEELARCYLGEYPGTEEQLFKCIQARVKNAVITAGENSVTLLCARSSKHEVFYPPKIEVGDTTGAGDVFAANFLSGLAQSAEADQTIRSIIKKALLRTAEFLQQ